MAPIEDARTYARVFLETCRAALQLQYERVLNLAEVPRDTTEWRTIEPDCYLLVIAIKQAILSLETVAHFEGDPIETRVTNAIKMLDREYGHPEKARHLGGLYQLTDLRDILTHFDAYLKGIGWLQPGGRLWRQRWANSNEDPSREFELHRKLRWNRHSRQVVLWVRAMGISVNVTSMSRLVMDLIDEVREAL
jgi:hypothetical protein